MDSKIKYNNMKKKKYIKTLNIIALLFLFFHLYPQKNENVRIIDNAATYEYSLAHDGKYSYLFINGIPRTGPIIDGNAIYENEGIGFKNCVVIVKFDSLNRYVSHFVTDTSNFIRLSSGSYKDAICFSGIKYTPDGELNPVTIYSLDENMQGEEIFATKDLVRMSGSFIKDGRLYLTGTFSFENGTNVIPGDSLLPMQHYLKDYGVWWQADNTIFTVIKDIEQDSFILKSTSGGVGDNKIYDVEMNDRGEMMVCGKCLADSFRINYVPVDAPNKPGLYKSGFVYKLDSDGNLIFVKLLYSNIGDYIYRLDYDDEGNTYIATSSFGRTSMFEDAVLSSNDSIGGQQTNILKLDEKGNIKWKVKIEGGTYAYTRTMEVGDDLVYVSALNTFVNDSSNIQIDSIALPCLGHETCYVIGLNRETGEYKNSFGYRGDVVIHNLAYINTDTLLVYGLGPVNEIMEGGSSKFKRFIFHRIGGLTGIHEIAEEKRRGVIYPNPVSTGNEISIVAPDGMQIENVGVYNLRGELIFFERIGQDEGTIKTGNLSPGIYLIKIETDEYEYMEKVIVVR